jgi:predicted nuclease of restriction endonuclease-like RecB superfamily
MSLLQVIFYNQVQLVVHDTRIFKTNMNNIDSLTLNFWMEKDEML